MYKRQVYKVIHNVINICGKVRILLQKADNSAPKTGCGFVYNLCNLFVAISQFLSNGFSAMDAQIVQNELEDAVLLVAANNHIRVFFHFRRRIVDDAE